LSQINIKIADGEPTGLVIDGVAVEVFGDVKIEWKTHPVRELLVHVQTPEKFTIYQNPELVVTIE